MNTIRFDVYLFAFKGNGEVRTVSVPTAEIALARRSQVAEVLERVFYWGQNDHQRMPLRSVSVGDIIQTMDGDYYRVDDFGFTDVSASFRIYLRKKVADERWAAEQAKK